MSTLNKTSLEIRVVDVDRRPVKDAVVVTLSSQPREIAAGRFALSDLGPGRVQLRVEARGYSPVELSIDVAGKKKYVDVILGEEGLPTLRRRNVPVPFRSPENMLGVIARGRKGATALESFIKERDLKLERPHGRDFTIIVCPPGQRDKVEAELRWAPFAGIPTPISPAPWRSWTRVPKSAAPAAPPSPISSKITRLTFSAPPQSETPLKPDNRY
jgi:hypothetical protein